MGAERHVKLFRNGRNQAVRIPREFELPGEDALMRKEGDRLVIEAASRKQGLIELLDWLAAQPPLDAEADFLEVDDPPPEPVDLFDDEND
jgi:antitoxin VapB